MPKLSIIIPSLNRFDDLLNTVEDLNNQSIDDIEIIIIDQTFPIQPEHEKQLKEIENVRYFYTKKPSASAARNRGLKEAKSELLLFLDDDVILQSYNYLKNILQHFQDVKTVGVVGPIIDAKMQLTTNKRPKKSYHKVWGWLYFPRNFMGTCFINNGGAGNLAVRRKNAIAIGGMDENFEKGAHREEADFNCRYTQEFGAYVYDPHCAILHIGRKTGGIRSWKEHQFVKVKHHMIGAIYFVLHTAPKRYFLIFFWDMLRYCVLNKTILSRPALWGIAFLRFFGAFGVALQKHWGGSRFME